MKSPLEIFATLLVAGMIVLVLAMPRANAQRNLDSAPDVDPEVNQPGIALPEKPRAAPSPRAQVPRERAPQPRQALSPAAPRYPVQRAYAPVPVPELPPPPPPIGWIYGQGVACLDPSCTQAVVSVSVDGLNVRTAPDGPVIAALANGTPVTPLEQAGPWVLVAAGCPLAPTYTISVTAGVPLSVCY